MKKIVVVIAVLLFVVVLSSCHLGEKCPAYADNNAEQTEQNG